MTFDYKQHPAYIAMLTSMPVDDRQDFELYTLPQFINEIGNKFTPEFFTRYAELLPLIPIQERDGFTRHALTAFIIARGDTFQPDDMNAFAQQYVAFQNLMPQGSINIANTPPVLSTLIKVAGTNFTPKFFSHYTDLLLLIPEIRRLEFTRIAVPKLIIKAGDKFTPEFFTQYTGLLALIPKHQREEFTQYTLPPLIDLVGNHSTLEFFSHYAGLLSLIPEGMQNYFSSVHLTLAIVTLGDDFDCTCMAALRPLVGIKDIAKLPANQIRAACLFLQNAANNWPSVKAMKAALQQADPLLNEIPSIKSVIDTLQTMDGKYWGAFHNIKNPAEGVGTIIICAMAVVDYCDMTGSDINDAFKKLGDAKKLASAFKLAGLANDYMAAVATGLALPIHVLEIMRVEECDYDTTLEKIENETKGDWDILQKALKKQAAAYFATLSQLYEGSHKWHQRGSKGALVQRQWVGLPTPEPLPQSIMENDGKTALLVIVPLTSSADLEAETHFLGHCVGLSDDYINKCTIGENGAFSHLLSVRLICPSAAEAKICAKAMGQQESQIDGNIIYLSTAELQESNTKYGRRLSTIQHYGYENHEIRFISHMGITDYMHALNNGIYNIDWQAIDKTRSVFQENGMAGRIRAIVGESHTIESLSSRIITVLLNQKSSTLSATLPRDINGLRNRVRGKGQHNPQCIPGA